MTAGGTLFTMNFTVNENATGNAALTINVVTFANMPAGSTTATPIAYIANNGAVVVGQPETPVPATDTPAPETPIRVLAPRPRPVPLQHPQTLRTSMRLSTLQAEPSPSLLKATILGS